jgi:hypothetical protein
MCHSEQSLRQGSDWDEASSKPDIRRLMTSPAILIAGHPRMNKLCRRLKARLSSSRAVEVDHTSLLSITLTISTSLGKSSIISQQSTNTQHEDHHRPFFGRRLHPQILLQLRRRLSQRWLWELPVGLCACIPMSWYRVAPLTAP